MNVTEQTVKIVGTRDSKSRRHCEYGSALLNWLLDRKQLLRVVPRSAPNPTTFKNQREELLAHALEVVRHESTDLANDANRPSCC